MSLERYSIIGLTFSVAIVLLDLYLIKKGKIDTGTFVRWFIVGLVVGVVSIFPIFLTFIYIILGTEILISAVTIAAFLVLLLFIFYLDYRLNELKDKLMKLTAELSALKYSKREASEDDEK